LKLARTLGEQDTENVTVPKRSPATAAALDAIGGAAKPIANAMIIGANIFMALDYTGTQAFGR
jgi:hypothetical protein